MRLLFIGDVVGRPGRNIVQDRLPALRERFRLDCVVINGENAAGGFGITEEICSQLIDAGADAVTLGNHSWDQREAMVFIARQPRLVRPVNFPQGAPGRGATLIDMKDGRRVLVVNALGRLYMDSLDDPFRAVEREVEACPLGQGCDAILIDMHAEATSEKQAMGYFLDGRVSVVVGTHTHAPTADHRILPHGTAYQSDAGMTGNYQSILGMDRHEPIRRWLEKTPGSRLEVAEGQGTMCGLAVETDDKTGLALNVAPLRVGAVLEETLPAFW
jgi:2',3'-cyclic-nucleotide 2'-phosphodiesterase